MSYFFFGDNKLFYFLKKYLPVLFLLDLQVSVAFEFFLSLKCHKLGV